jgi:dipeptidyl aminopeptidase/acylaminoacyl peptidase
MSSFAQSQLPLPAAIADPSKLESTPVKELQKFSLEQLYMTRSLGGSSWSPDGKSVVYVTNTSGRNNLWIAPLGGGWPQQLTVSDQRQASPAWSPDGQWIAFISDTDGNELWDIYLVSPKSGEVRNLTVSPDYDDEQPTWSPDGKRLAFITRHKDSPSFEIDIIDVATGHTTHVTRDTGKQWSNHSPLWSPDGKFLAFTRDHASGKDSDVFLANLASGEVSQLTPHTGDAIHAAAHFSPDGKQLLLTSDAHNGYANAALLEIASQKLVWLSEERWEIEAGEFTPDGSAVLWSANVDGYQQLYRRELASGKLTALPLPAGVNNFAGNGSSFSPDGSRLLFEHEGATSAPELWTLDWKSQAPAQLSHSMMAGVRQADMVEPVLVHYPSRDGKWTISAFAYIPHNIVRSGKYPAIVYIHGGPAAQSMAEFNRFVQYIANQGYVVIAPNYRGSTGYGQSFQDANRMDAGGGELDDVLDAAAFIEKSGFVDPKKLIVMGGSYGGYLSMMAVTKAPQRWAAGVPIVPFVNWFTEFANEDAQLQESDRLFMGDPVKDKALWMERSPVNFLDKVTAPLLLLAGGNDPRCPKTEAQQVAHAIKERGGKVQLKIYENEGHGFARVENNIDAYRRVSDFLKIHVPSPGCGCSIFE